MRALGSYVELRLCLYIVPTFHIALLSAFSHIK